MAELIVKSSLGIAISYLLYYCFIRNNTRFKWIRLYFLIAIAASLLIPVLSEILSFKEQVWVQIPEEYIREFLKGDKATQANNPAILSYALPFSLSRAALYLYLAGVFVVLFRFLIGFFHLLFLTFKFGIQKVGTDRLVILQNLPYPFTFLHLIFINRQTLSEGNHGTMLQHERAHVQQWHSLDLILLELLVAFQWFNPFAWLFRRSIKELHEYLADEEVLRHQTSTLDYQLLLFNQACGISLYQPVNGFKSSLTKKRILMMTSNKRNKKWFGILAAIIVAIFAIQSFSRINIAQDPPKKQKADTTGIYYPKPPPPPPVPEHADLDFPPPPPPPPPPFPCFKGTDEFKESNAAFGNYILKNAKVPSNSKEYTRTGIVLAITFDDQGKIINAEKGFLPKNSEIKTGPWKTEFTDDAGIINEMIRVVKNAPAFEMPETEDGSISQVIYAISIKKDECSVLPCSFVFNKNANNPVNKPMKGHF